MSDDRWTNVGTERLEAELVAWAARDAAAKAMFLDALGEFIARRGWEAWECVSVVQWLSWKCGLGRIAASEHARVAVALRTLPAVGAAMRDGLLSWSKVREITRVATADDEQAWIDVAAAATGAQVERTVRAFRRIHPAAAADQHDNRRFSWTTADDGSVLITVRLEAVQGAALIEAVRSTTTPTKGVPYGAACADRLVELVCGAGPVAVEVVIHVDGAVLDGQAGVCETAQGVPVAAEIAAQHLCQHPVRVAEHAPDGAVALSPRRRFVSPLQRRRLEARRRICAFPGCHNEGRLDAHHLIHATRGGPTQDANLTLLCASHHRLTHTHHLTLTLTHDADGDLAVTRADGTPIERPIQTLTLHPRTPAHTPTGSGEHLDLHHILTSLSHPPVSSRKQTHAPAA